MPHRAFMYFGVCPRPCITERHLELIKLYMACGGTERVRTPNEYYSLPQVYLAAVPIIEEQVAFYRRNHKDDG